MRITFGAEPDNLHWFCGWYDLIGFALACGKDWTWMRENWTTLGSWPQLELIIAWLEANFESDAWAEIGKR